MATKKPNRVTHRGDGTSLLELTQGKVTVIDTVTYPLVCMYRWHAHKDKKTFYAATSVWREDKRESRVLFMHNLLIQVKRPLQPDHCDRNGLNNRISNLHAVTFAQNMQNRKHPPNSSGRTGVTLRPNGKWQAEISVNGQRIYLGSFVLKRVAIRKRKEAEGVYF
jgi:hypothetical protein